MTVDDDLPVLAETVLKHYRAAGLRLATAESCTGGLIAAILTSVAGSSDVFERGFVTYSNQAKMDLLDVGEATLAAHGAVSPEVAAEMAAGALAHSRADAVVSVTGIAGPGGGNPNKPVGLVYLGYALANGAPPHVEMLSLGDSGREAVRNEAARRALRDLLKIVRN